MEIKNLKVTSFADIDRELEILNLEKEIKYEKLILSVQDIKQNYTPAKLLGIVPKVAMDLAKRHRNFVFAEENF